MEKELRNESESEGCLINAKKGIVEEKSSWVNLPNDLLSIIFSRLIAGDRAVFRCVCKSWKQVEPFKTNKKFLLNKNTVISPGIYLMCPNRDKIIRPIYDECHHANHFTIPSAIVHAEKGGWLLMTSLLDGIFFFNPFTSERIDLPHRDGAAGQVESAYVSAPPTSTSWTVFVSDSDDNVVIWTLKCGEERWSSNKSKKTEHYRFIFGNSAVVCKGLYYFLGEYAELLIHDPKRNSFRFYLPDESLICDQLTTKDAEHYLVESDGKVLAVFVSCDGNIIRVCRWVAYEKMWKEVKSLGDKMLFVSLSSSKCERATVRGTGNKIYFPRLMDDELCFYSLSTRKYHTFNSSYSFKSFEGLKHPCNSIWVKL